MTTTTIYGMGQVAAILDGVPVDGFAEGDGVATVTYNADVATATVGAGGDTLLSVTSNKSASVLLKLFSTSNAHRRLTEYHKRMLANDFRTFTFSLTNTANGEGGSSQACTISKAPVLAFGEKPGAREWTLHAGDWVPNEIEYLGTSAGLGASGGFELPQGGTGGFAVPIDL